MAEDLARIVHDDEPDKANAEATAMDDGTPPYQSRFQLLFGVLLGVAMAAIVATVVVVAGGRKPEDPGAASWAAWHPSASDGLQAVNQIADHVGQRYTLPSGNQLVGVRGGPLELANLPVTVAIAQAGQVKILDEKGVLYNLCGLGQSCSIKEGKPTYARSLVLRREALELALYTFRYIKNVNQVVVILPPRKGDKPGYAMFYRRGDVGASLDRPLAATLPGTPPVPPQVPKAEQNFIDNLTAGNYFAFTPQEGGDAHIYLVLRPPTG
ncbi:MAG: hypothetical protein QOJ29_5426 [Thermoleophilaceae bacterium]|nr:hypothetical protein [Thermoleophilaceae bacterium]